LCEYINKKQPFVQYFIILILFIVNLIIIVNFDKKPTRELLIQDTSQKGNVSISLRVKTALKSS